MGEGVYTPALRVIRIGPRTALHLTDRLLQACQASRGVGQARDVLTHREAAVRSAGMQRRGEPSRYRPAGDGQAG